VSQLGTYSSYHIQVCRCLGRNILGRHQITNVAHTRNDSTFGGCIVGYAVCDTTTQSVDWLAVLAAAHMVVCSFWADCGVLHCLKGADIGPPSFVKSVYKSTAQRSKYAHVTTSQNGLVWRGNPSFRSKIDSSSSTCTPASSLHALHGNTPAPDLANSHPPLCMPAMLLSTSTVNVSTVTTQSVP
jgi:hypothetical protein